MGQRRRIVDAVAHHGNRSGLFAPELGDQLDLLLGEQISVGLVEPDRRARIRPGNNETEISGASLIASRDATDDETLAECSGGGWAANLRVEYLFVVGPLFATGPHMQAGTAWTRCAAAMRGATDNDTGEPIELRQWWTHWFWSLGWGLVWR